MHFISLILTCCQPILESVDKVHLEIQVQICKKGPYLVQQLQKNPVIKQLCYSYTMGCPPVRGDNPRALASGLSYVQVDKHCITI